MYQIPTLPLKTDIETNKILRKLIKVHRELAKVNEVAKTIPNERILINSLILQESKDSSEIENIITTHDELYKSDIDISNISLSTKEVQKYRQALICGFDLVKKNSLLLNRDILQVQSIIEPNKSGFRKQMGTVIKNPATGEVKHTPPQNHQEILDLMSNLERYINEELDNCDVLVKMAIIHHQFESIHPFYDGNGRTGRIINLLYLVLKGYLDIPIVYISNYIIKHKEEYYQLLEKVQKEDSWEDWVMYILDAIEYTSIQTYHKIKSIYELMQETKHLLKTQSKIPNIKDLLDTIYSTPYTKVDFVVDKMQIHRSTASKYLQELQDMNILRKVKMGRSNYYINIKLFELLEG